MSENDHLPPIRKPFLLSVCVPLTIDDAGNQWIDALWAKDLSLHLDYLQDLTLICPCRHAVPEKDEISMRTPPFDRVKVVALPMPNSYWDGIRLAPEYALKYWKAVGEASIIQTGFGAWPISEGWFAVPMGKIRNRFVITNVESSFWRAIDGTTSIRKRLVAGAKEFSNRLCVRAANMRLFTSDAYAQDFLPFDAPRAHVIPATWINDEWVLTNAEAEAAWQKKSGPTRLLFAGRLIPDKGVSRLLEAIARLSKQKVSLILTLIGEGPLRHDCVQAAKSYKGSLKVLVLDPVPYGEPFLKLVREQDAVLIPSLSDEQPRLIFDALSQSVPIIGSDTGGIAEIVKHDYSGKLVSLTSLKALVDAISWACENRAALKKMGQNGLETSRGFTHQAMHTRRHQLLLDALPGISRGM